MIWTSEAKQKLETLWNMDSAHAPYSDEATGRILGTTVMAVARMRSTLGLVSRKVPFHNRDAKAVKAPLALPPYVLYYEHNGQTHFSLVEAEDEFVAKRRARAVMNNLGVKTAYVFKPHCQLIMQEITEVKL